MADYSKIVLNIEDIPDYISENRLKEIINIGIHDILRHIDIIKTQATVEFDITVNEIVNGNRKITIRTFLTAGLHSEVNNPGIARTIVQPDRQIDLSYADIIIRK